MHSSKVYSKLAERVGLADHLALLNVMLNKIATNLCAYGSSEQLVHVTLTLFQVGGGGREGFARHADIVPGGGVGGGGWEGGRGLHVTLALIQGGGGAACVADGAAGGGQQVGAIIQAPVSVTF